jgi:hypothetical protein
MAASRPGCVETDETTMRRITATPSGTFGCLCRHHRDDEKASLSDAF